MPVNDAIRAVDDLAGSPAFEDTFHNTRLPFSGDDIAVPVTVVFGDRDWILTKGSRRRSRLPAHAQWVEVHGWGHVPMWMDPIGVSQLILEAADYLHLNPWTIHPSMSMLDARQLLSKIAAGANIGPIAFPQET